MMKKRIPAKRMALFFAVLLIKLPLNVSAGEQEAAGGEDIHMQEFCEYLQEVVLDREWDELQRHVISRTLSWDEAAHLAEKTAVLANFQEYSEYFFNSYEAILVEADINGDGADDLIEYLPDVGNLGNEGTGNAKQNMLTIFAGGKGDSYKVMYYQPWFDTELDPGDEILAVGYGENIFILFIHGSRETWGREERIDVYRMGDGCFDCRCLLEITYGEMEAEVLECTEGFQETAEKYCSNGMKYFMDSCSDKLFHGNAETELSREQAGYAELEKIAEEERWEYIRRFQGPADGHTTDFISALELGGETAYYCDIDNDGTDELYARACGPLNMEIKTGNERYRFMTGALYGGGRHEGEYGLVYTMDRGGKKTDFGEICGLDIWKADDVPQMFWVEKCGTGNTTCILYKEKRGGGGRIEAYDIRNGKNKKVMEIAYKPEISVRTEYERNTQAQSGPGYAVRMSVKRGNAEIYGMEEQKIQEQVNENIKMRLWESMQECLHQSGKSYFRGSVYSNVLSATGERVVLLFTLTYSREGVEREYGEVSIMEISVESVCMEVNLKSGEVCIQEQYQIKEEKKWQG